jgi:hypothetical protein
MFLVIQKEPIFFSKVINAFQDKMFNRNKGIDMPVGFVNSPLKKP